MTKRISSIVLFTALLTAGLWWFGSRDHLITDEIAADAPDKPLLDEVRPSLGAEVPEQQEVPTQTTTGPSARRIVEVPSDAVPGAGSQSKFDDTNDISLDELEAFTRYNLDGALDGDFGAATRVIYALGRCRSVPGTLERLEQRVALQVAYRKRAEEEQRDLRIRPKSEEDLRNELMVWYQGCLFLGGVFNQALREKLDKMAQAGHVTARYIYALWKPDFGGSRDAFMLQQEWIDKATVYSLANLSEGEIAGLLAFGQSYIQSDGFTPVDHELGYSMLLAAFNCGYSDSRLNARLDGFLGQAERFGYVEDPRPRILNMAEGLVQYCR